MKFKLKIGSFLAAALLFGSQAFATYQPQNPNGSATSANSSPVVIASDQTALPLPTGASTSAAQTTGNNSLATVATNTGNIPAKGSATSANSTPVVIASDQAALPLPTGAATSAAQTTGNTSLSSIATNTGNIPAKGSTTGANSTPVVIASDQTAIATVSPVPTVTTSSTYAHTAVTTAYAFGQLWANNATAGSVTFQTISPAKANNQAFTLTGGILKKSGTSTTNAVFRIHLFNAAPTTAVADYGTFLANLTLANWIGSMDCTLNAGGSDVSQGLCQPTLGSVISSIPVSGAQTIYWVPEVRAAYTPISAETLTFTGMVQ